MDRDQQDDIRAMMVPRYGAARWLRRAEEARGDWDPGRDNPAGSAPWPAEDNPVVELLVDQAESAIQRVVSNPSSRRKLVEMELRQLVARAWFEGHVEGYDRAMREKGE